GKPPRRSCARLPESPGISYYRSPRPTPRRRPNCLSVSVGGREVLCHVLTYAILERREGRLVTAAPQPFHPGLRVVLIVRTDCLRHRDVLDAKRLAERRRDRARDVFEAARLPGSQVEDPAYLPLPQEPRDDLRAVADVHEVPKLAAVRISRIVRLEQCDRLVGRRHGKLLSDDALHRPLMVFVRTIDVEELQPDPLRRRRLLTLY